MELIVSLGISILLIAVFVRLIDLALELLSKFLLVLRFPSGPLSLFFQILGLGVPFAVLSLYWSITNQSQLIAGTAVGYSILALLGIPTLLGLRHKGTPRTVISSQSLASVLLGGFIFILAAIDQQISAIDGCIFLVLTTAYLFTGFKVPASQPLPHKTELSLGRSLVLLFVLILSVASVYFVGNYVTNSASQLVDSSVFGMTAIAFLFVIPLLIFGWKRQVHHTQTVIQTAAHNAIMILLGWVGLFAIFVPIIITPYVLVLGLLFLFLAIFCFFLIGREVIILNKFTAFALLCLIALYVVKIFFS